MSGQYGQMYSLYVNDKGRPSHIQSGMSRTVGSGLEVKKMEDGKGEIMVRNTPPSLPPSQALPFIPRGKGGEEEGKRRGKGGGRRRKKPMFCSSQ